MPGGIKMREMRDLVETTTEAMPSGRLVFSQKYREYPIMDKWFGGEERAKRMVRGGISIKEPVSLLDTGAAQMVRTGQRRTYGGEDTLQSLEMDWVKGETHYVITDDELDAHVDPYVKRGMDGLVDLINVKRADAQMSLANILEKKAWELPETHRDDINAAGIPYYVVKRDDDGAGFDGKGPLADDLCAGIDSDKFARWRNFAVRGEDRYSRPTNTADAPTFDDDVLDAMDMIYLKTGFVTPLTVQQYVDNYALQQQAIYLNSDTYLAMKSFMRQNRDDNRGSGELDWVGGGLTFNRRPLQVVPVLDGSTDSDGYKDFPIYYIDHGFFNVIVHEGREFYEYETMYDPQVPDVLVNLSMIKFQYLCRNRQRQGVMHAVTAST